MRRFGEHRTGSVLGRILDRLKSVDSPHLRIAGGMAWVGLFLVFGRGVGAVKEMAFAWRFGVGPAADAYTFIFFVLSYPMGFLTSVYATALVPVAKRSLPEQRATFRSELLGVSLILGVVATAITGSGMYTLVQWPSLGLSSEAVQIALPAIWIMALIVLPGFLNALFSAWILEKGKHANTLLEALPSLFVLGGLLFFSDHSIVPLAIVTTAGFMFQSLYLGFLIRRDDGPQQVRFWASSPLWGRFLRTAAIIFVSQGLLTMVQVVDTFFAASIGDNGSVATLGFANRFLSLLIGLGGTTISRAAISVFSENGLKSARLRQISQRWLLVLFAGGTVVVLVVWLAAPVIVRLFLERGAFTPADTVIVADLFRTGLFQLPFHWAALLLYTELASQGARRPIIIATSVAVGGKLLLNVLLRESMGLHGIQLASVFLQILLFFGLAAGRHLHGRSLKHVE